MKRLLVLLLVAAAPAAEAQPGPRKLTYPAARRGDTVDDYHGTKVADPYRWMEELDSKETRAWVDAQVKLTASVLDKLPGRSFTHDGRGFCYSAYDARKKGEEMKAASQFQKLYSHRLGTAQSDDELVYQRKDQPEWGFEGAVTNDGRYLTINVWHGTAN